MRRKMRRKLKIPLRGNRASYIGGNEVCVAPGHAKTARTSPRKGPLQDTKIENCMFLSLYIYVLSKVILLSHPLTPEAPQRAATVS